MNENVEKISKNIKRDQDICMQLHCLSLTPSPPACSTRADAATTSLPLQGLASAVEAFSAEGQAAVLAAAGLPFNQKEVPQKGSAWVDMEESGLSSDSALVWFVQLAESCVWFVWVPWTATRLFTQTSLEQFPPQVQQARERERERGWVFRGLVISSEFECESIPLGGLVALPLRIRVDVTRWPSKRISIMGSVAHGQ